MSTPFLLQRRPILDNVVTPSWLHLLRATTSWPLLILLVDDAAAAAVGCCGAGGVSLAAFAVLLSLS